MQLPIKTEKMDEDKKHETKGGNEEAGKLAVKEEEDQWKKRQSAGAADMGRLVMTVDGEQKQLSFGPKDLLTTATMLDGDKVSWLGQLLLYSPTEHCNLCGQSLIYFGSELICAGSL